MKQIRIYQLPVEHNAKFMNLEFVKKHNIMPKLGDYKVVYEAEVEDNATLDDIYRAFNIVHPRDFKGHSLSMSDIVYLDGKYFYCDSFSWKDVTEMFPKPTLKKGEKYECIADYVMEDKSIAYKAGKTYEMLSDTNLGIDEGGSDHHGMTEERDFFCYFKKVDSVHKVTLAGVLIHLSKNGDILYGSTKIGTYEKDDLWKKQGGTRDRSGNKTVPFLYYVTIDAMPTDRGKRIFYSRKEIKEWLSGKQITIDFNAK